MVFICPYLMFWFFTELIFNLCTDKIADKDFVDDLDIVRLDEFRD